MENKQTNSRPWYLLTGILLGMVMGMLVAIFILPSRFREAEPINLDATAKKEYRLMIARAYSGNPDLPRALARLHLLGDEDSYTELVAQAQLELASGGLEAEANARTLAALAMAIQARPDQP